MQKPAAKVQKGLAITIADKIRTAIVDAEFEFGESLSEDILADAFDVSRTPVREALNLLQMEGLVYIVPKSGTYVFTPTLEDIAELCDYRAGLEQLAVKLTANRDLPIQVASLQTLLDVMTVAIANDDMRAYGRADTAFHLVLLGGCGNRYLQNAYNLVLGRVASLRTHLAMTAEGEPDRSYRDHQAMISLLVAGEREALSAMLEAHILRTKDNYLNAFEKISMTKGDARTVRLRRRLSIAG